MRLADLFDSTHMAVLVLDKEGYVRYINPTYLGILGHGKEEEVIGAHIGAITPQSRALMVTKTGKAIIGYPWIVNGHNMIGCAVPLIRNGEVKGCFAYSLFMDILEAKDLVDNLMSELKMYKDEVRSCYASRYTFSDIAGQGPAMADIKFLAQKAALHPTITVLLNGESGTGKELFAHAIHQASSRSLSPFIRVNCAAIPENLLEAELFGYVDGAFTGARKGGSTGKLELAHGGTVFLDEIGEMSTAMQSKLLVFLQEREFERLGSHQPVRVNVRIIAATNRNLEDMVENHEFREDLYYRLNVLRLDVPPLRERLDDIPALVSHIIPYINRSARSGVNEISDSGLAILMRYRWPGNVRELINVLERAILLADIDGARTVQPVHLGFIKTENAIADAGDQASLKNRMRDYEKQLINASLEENRFNKARTARSLDIDLSWLYKKMKQYGMNSD